MGDHRAQGPGYRPGFNLYKREGSRFNGIVLILFINLSGCIPPRYRIQNKEISCASRPGYSREVGISRHARNGKLSSLVAAGLMNITKVAAPISTQMMLVI